MFWEIGGNSGLAGWVPFPQMGEIGAPRCLSGSAGRFGHCIYNQSLPYDSGIYNRPFLNWNRGSGFPKWNGRQLKYHLAGAN